VTSFGVIFLNGDFREFRYWVGDFPVSEQEFPVALVKSVNGRLRVLFIDTRYGVLVFGTLRRDFDRPNTFAVRFS